MVSFVDTILLRAELPANNRRQDVPLAALPAFGVVRHHPVHHVLRTVGYVGHAVQAERSARRMMAHDRNVRKRAMPQPMILHRELPFGPDR